MGLPSLREIFNEKYYENLDGGILESFGRMFKHDLRLYVSPAIDQATGKKEGVMSLKVDEHLRHLYMYLLENNYVKALDTVKEEYLRIFSHEVLYNMQKGHHEWESMVPDKVCQMIREQRLFDWCGG